jgi:hypothetical protein
MQAGAGAAGRADAHRARQRSTALRGAALITVVRARDILRNAESTVAWYRLRRAADAPTLREAVPRDWAARTRTPNGS